MVSHAKVNKNPRTAKQFGEYFYTMLIRGRFSLCPLDLPILLLSIEAGTVFTDAWQVPMTEDDGLGVVLAQRPQQGMHGGFLLGGAGVLGLAILVQAAQGQIPIECWL